MAETWFGPNPVRLWKPVSSDTFHPQTSSFPVCCSRTNFFGGGEWTYKKS